MKTGVFRGVWSKIGGFGGFWLKIGDLVGKGGFRDLWSKIEVWVEKSGFLWRNGVFVGFWSRNQGKVGKSREFDDFLKIGENREK